MPELTSIHLGYFGIIVTLDGRGGGMIVSDLHDAPTVTDEAVDYGNAVDAIESLILAHACAGVDIASPAYIRGIETAVEKCAAQHL